MAEQAEQKEKNEPRTYHRDRLIAEAGAFVGEPHYVVEAALSMGRNASKVNFTLDEVEKAVKAFNEHEVEIDHPVAATDEEE